MVALLFTKIVENDILIYQSTVEIPLKYIFYVYKLNQTNIKLLPPMLSSILLG